MSDDIEREFWLAGGADLEKAKAFIAERGAAIANMQIAAKAYGGTAVSNGYSITGLMFEGDTPPVGWSKKGDCDGKPFFLPKRTSKELRDIAAELAKHRMKGASGFHALMTSNPKNGGVMKPAAGGQFGMRLLYIIWEWIGDDLLLSVPTGEDVFTPNGSRKLAMSEYWAMREAAEKAVAA
mgnify:CR=1 FL=1